MLMLGSSAQAQDVSGYPIGHCKGELSTSSKLKHDVAGDWVSSAIYISPEISATVAGKHIDKMHVGVCSTIHVEKLKIWVRSELSGSNLAEATVDVDALAKGWNMVDFATPYNIPDNGKGFYLGYSVLQDGRSAGPTLLKQPGTGSCYYQAGNGEWQDKSDTYTLCLEGMVYGDNLPKYNITLMDVTPQPVFIVSDGNLKCTAKVYNRGIAVVSGLDFKIEVSGADPVNGHADCNIPFGEEQEMTFTVQPVLKSPAEKCDVKVTISAVNGNADEDPSDNMASSSFSVMEDAFPRMVVVEEFTTENCPNCPAAARHLHSILENPQYADNVVAVCHHSGYTYDIYTTPFDREYEWFYNNNGSIFAPAMMLDRTPTVETHSAVFFPANESMLREEIDKRMALPSQYSVSVDAAKGEGEVNVSVSCERIGNGGDDLYLTLFLVENDIPTSNQAGSGDGYLHQHVGRAVNATWGEPVAWSGNSYTYEYTFTLDSKWVYDNLEVVAFLGRYDSGDAKACTIENAGHRYLGNKGGISVNPADANKTVTGYYDMMGRKLPERPSEGIYVTTYSDGTSSKFM